MEPGEGKRLCLKFNNGVWYAGEVIAYDDGDPSGVRFPDRRRVHFDDGDEHVVFLSKCRVPGSAAEEEQEAEGEEEEPSESEEEEEEQGCSSSYY